MKKRAISFLLVLILTLSLCCVPARAEEPLYGSIPIYIGYGDVDYMAEEILKEIDYEGKDARGQIQAVYDWIIYNCDRYSWDGTYYFDEDEVMANAPTFVEQANQLLAEGRAVIRPEWADYFGIYTGDASYDTNYYIASFAYDMMMTRAGNCAHYSALLALLLGHLGFDCRLIPGEFINGDGSQVEHKWNYVLVDGEYYWLDVRIDHSVYTSVGYITHDYFMVADTAEWEDTHVWNPPYSQILADSAAEIEQQYNNVGHTHELVFVESSEPDCETDGATEHYECTICGDCWLDAEGQEWVSRSEVTIPALGHDWSEWTVLEESTYDQPGLRERVCGRNPEHVQQQEIPPIAPPFADVSRSDYFFEPVLWAVENGITTGMTDTRFGPKEPCTRAQVVTFLWRAAGCPEPVGTELPFVDVDPDSYYGKAVLWAVENDITSGMTATQFCPKDPCTRAQVVTFLWRTAGCPEPESLYNPFYDVKESGYYYTPVLWAVENGITTGIDETHFCPGNTCTRGQIVTFLHRAYT